RDRLRDAPLHSDARLRRRDHARHRPGEDGPDHGDPDLLDVADTAPRGKGPRARRGRADTGRRLDDDGGARGRRRGRDGRRFRIGQFLRWSIVPYFLIFYVLGYMIYVCIYAVGGAIANSEKEAQAATTPAMLIVMLPWFLLTPILLNPDSAMATSISMIPLFT